MHKIKTNLFFQQKGTCLSMYKATIYNESVFLVSHFREKLLRKFVWDIELTFGPITRQRLISDYWNFNFTVYQVIVYRYIKFQSSGMHINRDIVLVVLTANPQPVQKTSRTLVLISPIEKSIAQNSAQKITGPRFKGIWVPQTNDFISGYVSL